MELMLLNNLFISIIHSGNAIEIALACTIPLAVTWYITDSPQTHTQERLHRYLGLVVTPLLFAFICLMIIQIIEILGP